ncbi:filamentous hemagglutinin N-terminal domain-containing protein [Chroococcidiopsis sp. FACHB-1243]|uniref:two-partner secretion domain-containing protein n=1 Tax=Chroococcidiopsis sp. [FACHB-1243] TaxID=2692781 RepID=UPI001784DCFD|nr:filamentous hemagglutinin N-terminal domain-containing protein [Chroococcidiopsis sp. [FACHB-1243]]MBD2304066.1 filamentous hemagglutinin N-terminal domain-containing protein [Chroococcidiopsis sp. [FACHB-1243]]
MMRIFWREVVRLGLAGVVIGSTAFGSHTLAQVPPDSQLRPDNTLGVDNSTVNSSPDGIDRISGGATRGSNLFHSFEQFSIPNGRAALFDNGANIQNILTRVTGGSVSEIDGILAARGTANLFLLNPNGIIFGQNARLIVGGSFIATTANSINFADGTQFSTTPGTGAPLLTVSVPLGLQFGTNPGNIVNRASTFGLQVQPGRTIGLIGGNVSLEGGDITAAGGRIELGAVAAPGVVGLNTDNSGFRLSFPTDLALGDISLTNDSFVDVAAGGDGSIAVNANNLSLFGGSEINSGIAPNQGTVNAVAGNIDINASAITIDGQNQAGFSSGFFNNVSRGSTGKGGNINVKTGSLSMTNRGTIAASTFGTGDAGNVNITASDRIALDGGSIIFSRVRETAKGNGGNLTLAARSLSLTNDSELTTSTLGQGSAGYIQVNVADALSINGSSSLTATSASQGNSGNITITAGGLVSLDGGVRGNLSGISSLLLPTAASEGVRQGGEINITARSLSVTNGAQIATTTVGRGNAGNIRVDATDDVSILGNAAIQAISASTGNAGNITVNTGDRIVIDDSSGILSAVIQFGQFRGEGEGGDINIKARSLSLSNGSQVGASSQGRGNAGNIQIDVADSLDASGKSFIQAFSNGEGNAGNITINAGDRVAFSGTGASSDISGIISSIEENTPRSDRRAGDINIRARSLFLSNGALLETSARNSGNAGNIQLNLSDSVSISSGALLRAISSSPGSSGNINITAGGLVSVDGVGTDGLVSGIVNSLGPTVQFEDNRQSGDIEIKARSLAVTDRAQIIASTFGQGDAGDIRVDATDDVTVSGGGVLQAISGGRGNAGNISVNAGDRISIDGIGTNGVSSGIYSAVGQIDQFQGEGRGGDIRIDGRSLFLTNGAQLNSSNQGQGNAGNIDIEVRSLDLDAGNILAATNSGDGGNIQLRASKSLRLRNSSRISATAGAAQQAGNGGNITIDSPLIIANSNGNNDITANAFSGSGGRVDITADSIFGLAPLSRQELQTLLGTDDPARLDPGFLPSNDITAISQTNPSLSGTVTFNAADIDPSRDVVELPTGLVDASTLVAAGCPSGAENRFAITGRGGLPPAPGDKLSPDALLTNWASLPTETSNSSTVEKAISQTTNPTATPIVEATTWQFGSQGEIILTNANSSTTPNSFDATPTSCSSSS